MSKGEARRSRRPPGDDNSDRSVEVPSLMGARLRRRARQAVRAVMEAPLALARALAGRLQRARD
jgi:hypothetical protein